MCDELSFSTPRTYDIDEIGKYNDSLRNKSKNYVDPTELRYNWEQLIYGIQSNLDIQLAEALATGDSVMYELLQEKYLMLNDVRAMQYLELFRNDCFESSEKTQIKYDKAVQQLELLGLLKNRQNGNDLGNNNESVYSNVKLDHLKTVRNYMPKVVVEPTKDDNWCYYGNDLNQADDNLQKFKEMQEQVFRATANDVITKMKKVIDKLRDQGLVNSYEERLKELSDYIYKKNMFFRNFFKNTVDRELIVNQIYDSCQEIKQFEIDEKVEFNNFKESQFSLWEDTVDSIYRRNLAILEKYKQIGVKTDCELKMKEYEKLVRSIDRKLGNVSKCTYAKLIAKTVAEACAKVSDDRYQCDDFNPDYFKHEECLNKFKAMKLKLWFESKEYAEHKNLANYLRQLVYGFKDDSCQEKQMKLMYLIDTLDERVRQILKSSNRDYIDHEIGKVCRIVTNSQCKRGDRTTIEKLKREIEEFLLQDVNNIETRTNNTNFRESLKELMLDATIAKKVHSSKALETILLVTKSIEQTYKMFEKCGRRSILFNKFKLHPSTKFESWQPINRNWPCVTRKPCYDKNSSVHFGGVQTNQYGSFNASYTSSSINSKRLNTPCCITNKKFSQSIDPINPLQEPQSKRFSGHIEENGKIGKCGQNYQCRQNGQNCQFGLNEQVGLIERNGKNYEFGQNEQSEQNGHNEQIGQIERNEECGRIDENELKRIELNDKIDKIRQNGQHSQYLQYGQNGQCGPCADNGQCEECDRPNGQSGQSLLNGQSMPNGQNEQNRTNGQNGQNRTNGQNGQNGVKTQNLQIPSLSDSLKTYQPCEQKPLSPNNSTNQKPKLLINEPQANNSIKQNLHSGLFPNAQNTGTCDNFCQKNIKLEPNLSIDGSRDNKSCKTKTASSTLNNESIQAQSCTMKTKSNLDELSTPRSCKIKTKTCSPTNKSLASEADTLQGCYMKNPSIASPTSGYVSDIENQSIRSKIQSRLESAIFQGDNTEIDINKLKQRSVSPIIENSSKEKQVSTEPKNHSKVQSEKICKCTRSPAQQTKYPNGETKPQSKNQNRRSLIPQRKNSIKRCPVHGVQRKASPQTFVCELPKTLPRQVPENQAIYYPSNQVPTKKLNNGCIPVPKCYNASGPTPKCYDSSVPTPKCGNSSNPARTSYQPNCCPSCSLKSHRNVLNQQVNKQSPKATISQCPQIQTYPGYNRTC